MKTQTPRKRYGGRAQRSIQTKVGKPIRKGRLFTATINHACNEFLRSRGISTVTNCHHLPS